MVDKNHVYKSVYFCWNKRGVFNELTVRDKTMAEAEESAKAFGWRKPTWYKPWTWGTMMWVQE